MIEDYKEKAKDIEEVYALWKGLYISPNSAMSRIGNIVKSEYRIIKNAQFLNDRNVIGNIDTMTVKIRRKQ